MKTKFTLILFLLTGLLITKLSAQTTTKNFDFEGQNRQYVLHIPANYDPSIPTPLVFSLHGLGDNIANFSQAGMHDVADTANFIVVTPQAIEFAYLGFSVGTAWNSGVGAYVDGTSLGFPLTATVFPNEEINDVGFIEALIDSVSTDYNVDLERVYATGFSMGGFMCNRLAIELNNKIAAIASVSGTLGANVDRSTGTPIPVLHIHGTADATILYQGNNPNGDLYTILGDSVPGLLEYWVSNNNCDMSYDYEANYATVSGHVVEHFKWNNGTDSTVVEHLKVNGGDHEWFYPFYPREIWKFFKQHKNKEIQTGIKNTQEIQLQLYPNPSADVVHLTSRVDITNIKIYNYLGLLVLETKEQKINDYPNKHPNA